MCSAQAREKSHDRSRCRFDGRQFRFTDVYHVNEWSEWMWTRESESLNRISLIFLRAQQRRFDERIFWRLFCVVFFSFARIFFAAFEKYKKLINKFEHVVVIDGRCSCSKFTRFHWGLWSIDQTATEAKDQIHSSFSSPFWIYSKSWVLWTDRAIVIPLSSTN